MTLAITSRQEPTAKPVASQVQTSEVTPEVKTTVDPVFNQDFKFRVDDAPNSRLDVTLWDSDISTTGDEGFLGEVLLNIGKLMSYAGTAIQQTFTVRSMMGANGKTESCGQFVMILQYDHARKTSANVGAVGISIKMPMPWSEVKPDRPRYETAIRQMVRRVQDYVPGYRLVQDPVFDPVMFENPSLGAFEGTKVSVFLEVEGAGDWLPVYAGNLDIMTAAALRMGEEMVRAST